MIVALNEPTPVQPSSDWKSGPLGPGAGVLQTEFPLAMILGRNSPPQRMRKWLDIATQAGWPRTAEDAIATALLNQPWVIEDAQEKEVDAQYADAISRSAYDLLEKPQAKVELGRQHTRSEFVRLTLRHVGICGTAFWFLDQLNGLGLPEALLYIQPWRMTPNEDARGNLLSWQLDKTPQSPGIKIELDRLRQFVLHPPDTGHYGVSMMEIALLKAQNDIAFDRHVGQVLDAGGRLSGLLAPKTGDSLNNDQYNQLVADARTIVEQPDAAKRLQIMRGPVEFMQTTMTIADLQIAELLKSYRDDTLSLWGVPPGYVVPNPAGLSSGEARKYDKQVLWENAAQSRAVMLEETIQSLLDLWPDALEFDIADPSFGNDDARYDLLGKSLNAPLRNRERRELVGLEPFGPDVINPATGIPLDDEVWLPTTQAMVFVAPEEKPGVLPTAPEQVVSPEGLAQADAAAAAAGETAQNPRRPGTPKASLPAVREQLAARFTPRVRASVAAVLSEQRRELTQRAKGAAAHLLQRPGDRAYLSSLWDEHKWNRRMTEALQPHLVNMAERVDAHVRSTLKPMTKAGPVGAVDATLKRGATRVTALNRRTRDAVIATIRETVAQGIADGKSPATVGDDLETALSGTTLDNGQPAFDELRAETIARTEMTAAYNDAAIGSYRDMGVTEVTAMDGDQDEECAARDGQTFTLDEAAGIEDHVNGTLDWIPVVEYGEPKAAPIRDRLEAIKAEVLSVDRFATAFESAAQSNAQVASAVVAALERIGSQPPAVVNMPEIVIPPTVVNVAAAKVTVPPAVVNVTVPEPRPTTRTIAFPDGRTATITEEPA